MDIAQVLPEPIELRQLGKRASTVVRARNVAAARLPRDVDRPVGSVALPDGETWVVKPVAASTAFPESAAERITAVRIHHRRRIGSSFPPSSWMTKG
jgi:hypothetical protein